MNKQGGLNQMRMVDGKPAFGFGGSFKKAFKKVKKGVKKYSKPFTAPFEAIADAGIGLVKGDSLGDIVKEAGNTFGEAGEVLTPFIGAIPGIGVPLAAGFGAASNALQGDNRAEILGGAIKGGLSGYAGSKVGGLPGLYDKATGLLGQGLGNTAAGAGQVVADNGLSTVAPGVSPVVGAAASGAGAAGAAGGSGVLGGLASAAGNLGGLGRLAGAALGAGVLGGAVKGGKGGGEIPDAAAYMTESQKRYFNMPSLKWDWDQMQDDSSASGQGLNEYIANNWHAVGGAGAYNQMMPRYWDPASTPNAQAHQPLMAPPQQQQPAWKQTMEYQQLPPQQFAHGGLSQYTQGQGSGRSDQIESLLSPNEYVMDAETVAMLGDGNPDEGARLLDDMRERIRKHKGQALAKGHFSPDAKSPLEYMKKKDR